MLLSDGNVKLSKSFSHLSFIGAEKITLPPPCLLQTDGRTFGIINCFATYNVGMIFLFISQALASPITTKYPVPNIT